MGTEHPDIQVVLFDGRPTVPTALGDWLNAQAHVARASQIIGDRRDGRIDEYRNLVARWFLDHTSLPRLAMVDDDSVPVGETEELFHAEGWVLGANFIDRKGVQNHPADGEIGFCMALIDRRVFARLPDDPFSLAPGDGCECGAFCRRCREAGMWVRKAGVVGHALTLHVVPDGPGVKVRFPDAPAPQRSGEPSGPPFVALSMPGGGLFVGAPQSNELSRHQGTP